MNVLPDNLIAPITIVVAVLVSIGLFFLVLTRISLIYQANSSKSDPDTAHIYWIYKSPFFIRLTDRMFVPGSTLTQMACANGPGASYVLVPQITTPPSKNRPTTKNVSALDAILRHI